MQKYVKIPHQTTKKRKKISSARIIYKIIRKLPFHRKKLNQKSKPEKKEKIVIKKIVEKKNEKMWGIVGNFIIFAPRIKINKYTQ